MFARKWDKNTIYLAKWTQDQVKLGNAQQLLGIVLGEEFESGGTLWTFYRRVTEKCLKGRWWVADQIPSGFEITARKILFTKAHTHTYALLTELDQF